MENLLTLHSLSKAATAAAATVTQNIQLGNL